jgi:hypothetical protein
MVDVVCGGEVDPTLPPPTPPEPLRGGKVVVVGGGGGGVVGGTVVVGGGVVVGTGRPSEYTKEFENVTVVFPLSK